ncbi:MAG: MarR family winged helix-turn-helix transcriptional regulator [Acidimicrobiales bacterium]
MAARSAGPDPSDIPVLLRAARGAYGNVIAARLAADGFDDLPRNGPFVLGGMAHHGGSAVEMIKGLGVTRQAASQLVDMLVLRGYLSREVNGEDRRRMDLELTERGRAAADVVRAAVKKVDRQLTAMLSTRELAGLRAGLAALSTIRERSESDRGR